MNRAAVVGCLLRRGANLAKKRSADGCLCAGSGWFSTYRLGAASDPILSLQHSVAEIQFERAPAWVVRSCNDPPFHRMWIFGAAVRPEGTYILASGAVWVPQDVGAGQPIKLDLQNDGNGEINLIHKDRTCEGLWDGDNALNGFFPLQAGNLPTPAQAGIVRDIAIDLIKREEKIFGGREGFFKALAATGHGIQEQDSVMIPLLESLKSNGWP